MAERIPLCRTAELPSASGRTLDPEERQARLVYSLWDMHDLALTLLSPHKAKGDASQPGRQGCLDVLPQKLKYIYIVNPMAAEPVLLLGLIQ